MTGDSFEYAIRKDVRNNPVVREIDRERQRELWRAVGVGLFLVTVLVFSVWRQVDQISHDRKVEKLRAELAEEAEDNRWLRMERDSRRAHVLIDDLARRKLKMVEPDPGDYEIIERVVPALPPPRTVVAQR